METELQVGGGVCFTFKNNEFIIESFPNETWHMTNTEAIKLRDFIDNIIKKV